MPTILDLFPGMVRLVRSVRICDSPWFVGKFGFEIDRFVIILVLRFVVWRSCYQETRGWGNDNLFCCCAACEGVWWMPWQTVPMKDV